MQTTLRISFLKRDLFEEILVLRLYSRATNLHLSNTEEFKEGL